jgi:hypothetical protein
MARRTSSPNKPGTRETTMMHRLGLALWLTVAVLTPGRASATPADPPPKAGKHRCPKPAEFALVFSLGYAADRMPQDDARFEQLLKTVRAAGFNTVHCTYTARRLELCKRHRVRMMIDLLAPEHHVFKSPEKARAVCAALRNNPGVWGYNIWNDNFGKSAAGRRRDVEAVRKWDPTHPAYCGTYRTRGMKQLDNADILGYYDFHWKRGLGQHFPHLLAYRAWARERDAWFYSWLSATSGRAGAGNYNRCLYSANTGVACGLKGVLWFLGTDLMDPKTLAWTAAGRDIAKVNAEIAPLARELAKVGTPLAVYSTAVTRTPNNVPLPEGTKAALPAALEGHAFPAAGWLQPVAGEFVLGVFEDTPARSVVFIANHNAYAEQDVALKLSRPGRVSWFDRKAGGWQALTLRDGVVRFRLAAAGGELIRVDR